MKLKIVFLAIVLFFSHTLIAQEELKINWDYHDQTFTDFVIKAENQLQPAILFYTEDWVKDLHPGNYPGVVLLPEMLE